jgi:hypothetical protein
LPAADAQSRRLAEVDQSASTDIPRLTRRSSARIPFLARLAKSIERRRRKSRPLCHFEDYLASNFERSDALIVQAAADRQVKRAAATINVASRSSPPQSCMDDLLLKFVRVLLRLEPHRHPPSAAFGS